MNEYELISALATQVEKMAELMTIISERQNQIVDQMNNNTKMINYLGEKLLLMEQMENININ